MSPAPELDDTPTVIAPGDPLLEGTRLRDYEIRGLAGEGAFAIVYRAWDVALQREVAIQEYLPMAIASRLDGSLAVGVKAERHADTFKAGLRSFVDEARLLARFDHPSLVKVYRFWEENGTAYMVMPFYAGPTLKTALAELGHVPSESELRTWLKPILNAVTVLHEGGCWHQNIGPDEIVLTSKGPVLLGFQSAGHAIEGVHHTPAAALKPGYAAIEQYGSEAETTRGPWTDLYAIGAMVYGAIAGAEPPPAPARLARDALQPLSQVAAGLYSDGFLAAVDAALAVDPGSRPADHLAFRALMGDIQAPDAPVSLAPRRDLMQEPFLGDVTQPPEVTVPDRPLLAAAEAAPATEPASTAAGRARGSAAATPQASSGAAGGERLPPSWMKGGARSLGKRALYGIVAVTCVAIGMAALALQYYLRPAVRPTLAAPVAVPAPAVAPATRDLTIAPVAAVVPATPSAASAPSAPSASASAPPAAIAATTATAERQARCTDILQKASLERISAADTDYFKRECK